MLPLLTGMRGDTLFMAFVLNSVAAALVSTLIVEIRLAQSKNSSLLDGQAKMGITFVVGLLTTFAVYNLLYAIAGYGSSLAATKRKIPYW
tara:strand:- start:22731 stop:23000 length:270 start_codon:yes stop_codon:yes gene_type:complete